MGYRIRIGGETYKEASIFSAAMTQPLFEKLSVGNACSAELTVEFEQGGDIPKMATVIPEATDGNGLNYSALGTFYIDTRSRSAGRTKITAYDAMLKADVVWEPDQSMTFPMAMPDAVNAFCELMGVDLDSRTELNRGYTIDYPANDYTIRDILRFIAAAHGGNWVITSEGKLRLVPLVMDVPTVTLTATTNVTLLYNGDDPIEWTWHTEDTGEQVAQADPVKLWTVLTVRSSGKAYMVYVDGKLVHNERSEAGGSYDLRVMGDLSVRQTMHATGWGDYSSVWDELHITTTPVSHDGALHDLGKKVSSFEAYSPSGPVTGIELLVDDENMYKKGSEDGYIMEVHCPYGTEQMAEDLLGKLSGYTYYGYHADGAELPIKAELGDMVSVSGVDSVLAYRKLSFGPLALSEISAPGENELEHEYEYISQEQRETNRKIATTRSLITKTAEEIGLQVNGLEGEYAQLKLTLDGVTITDLTGTTRIKGSSIDTSTISAKSITAAMINTAGLAAEQLEGNKISIIGTSSIMIDGEAVRVVYGTIKANNDSAGSVALEIDGQAGIRLLSSEGNVYLRSQGGQSLQLGGDSGTCQLGGGPLAIPTSSYGNKLPENGISGQVYFLIS